MNIVCPVQETADTVTLRRADFETLMDALADKEGAAAAYANQAHERAIGWEAARDSYYSAAETRQLLDGATPLRIWRTRRGLAQRTLAEQAGMSASYLAEIEAGRKPGSAAAWRRLAEALHVPMETLLSE